jgi:RND superfamily putative drug exporter
VTASPSLTRPATSPPPSAFRSLGLWSARFRWVVVAAWVAIMVGVTLASGTVQGAFNAQLSLPSSHAEQGAALLQRHVGGTSSGTAPQSGQIVFHTGSSTLATHRAAIQKSVAALRADHDVTAISDPFTTVSSNRRVAVATLQYATSVVSADTPQVTEANTAVRAARAAGVSVDYGADLGSAAKPAANVSAELIGIAIALIVLLIAFGSVLATILPVLSAAIGVFAGIGTLGTLAALIQFPSESPTIGLMMGLGVGIDYALFLSTRFRQRILDGATPANAAADTVASSGRAVVIAAATVIISLVGLYAAGIFYIGQLGIAAGITVLVAAAAAITLAPALLAIAGTHIDRLRVRRRTIAEPAGVASGWTRYANHLGRHPVVALVSALAVLSVLAIPLLTIRLGTPARTSGSTQSTEARAAVAIADGFGAGSDSALTIVVSGSTATGLPALAGPLRTSIQRLPGVASVTAFGPSPDRKLLIASVIPTGDGSTASTVALVHDLDRTVLPAQLAGSGASGFVTGSVAGHVALDDAVSTGTPAIILTVVAAATLLILLTFRSPVLALKAGLVNLLSIGASFGVIVAVFQWGWGSALLGVSGPVPIVSFVPTLMFAIVFGLSMDYEVFLLARIREAWLRTHDNGASIAHGLGVTGRIIGCAAIIMAGVFFSFLLNDSITIKMLALGLGVSVILDATLVRLVVVPAAMHLFDRANWWTPRWLDRVLPHLEP